MPFLPRVVAVGRNPPCPIFYAYVAAVRFHFAMGAASLSSGDIPRTGEENDEKARPNVQPAVMILQGAPALFRRGVRPGNAAEVHEGAFRRLGGPIIPSSAKTRPFVQVGTATPSMDERFTDRLFHAMVSTDSTKSGR